MTDLESLLTIILVICGLPWIVLLFVIKERHEYDEVEYPERYFSNLKFWRKILGYISLITFIIYLLMFGNKYS